MYAEKRGEKWRFVESYTDPITGKRKRVSCTLDRNTAAARKDAARILTAKIDKALYTPDNPDTLQKLNVGAAMALYGDYKGKTLKPSSMNTLRPMFNRIVQALGAETRIAALNAGYIRKHLLDDLDPTTSNSYMATLKTWLRWLYANDYIADVAWLDKLQPARVQQADRRYYLEREELQLVLDNCNDNYRNIITFLALSGLRVGEATALTPADVNCFSRKIHVDKTYNSRIKQTMPAKTADSIRDVYMQDELLALCKDITAYNLHICPDTRLFFFNHVADRHWENCQYEALHDYFKQLTLDTLGEAYTLHMLRHTHASLLFEAGVSLEAVSRRLGHADSKITREIYLHITAKKEAEYNSQVKDVHLLNGGSLGAESF